MKHLKWADLPQKSIRDLKKQLEKDLRCSIDGCDQQLTYKSGPGKDLLCEEHQKNLREFGGTGRIDRPHTHHRKWVCDICGKNIQEEVRKLHPTVEEENPTLFSRLCRNRIIADHKIRKVDGGSDSAENIQSLCLDCNSDKTILNEDWRN